MNSHDTAVYARTAAAPASDGDASMSSKQPAPRQPKAKHAYVESSRMTAAQISLIAVAAYSAFTVLFPVQPRAPVLRDLRPQLRAMPTPESKSDQCSRAADHIADSILQRYDVLNRRQIRTREKTTRLALDVVVCALIATISCLLQQRQAKAMLRPQPCRNELRAS